MTLSPHDASIGKTAPAIDNSSMAQRILSTHDAEDKADDIPELVAGELSNTFAMLDPDLIGLHKDLEQAAMKLAAAKKSGKNIDMAKMTFESAESAYQTRLYEVRKGALLKDIEEQPDDNAQAKKELHGLTMQQKMNEEFAALRQKRKVAKRRKEEKSKGGFFFYFMLGLALANFESQRMAQNMQASQLRQAFSGARARS